MSSLLLSGCITEAIDNIAYKLSHNPELDVISGKIDAVGECREICFEKYGVIKDDIDWGTEHEFGGNADNCYTNCYRLL